MKFIIAVVLALAAVVAVNGSYLPSVVSYSAAVPTITSSSVWPAYGGLYGKAAVASYATYPRTYGNWPLYGKTWGFSAAAPVVTKVVDNGLWNYGGYGYGFNKYWL